MDSVGDDFPRGRQAGYAMILLLGGLRIAERLFKGEKMTIVFDEKGLEGQITDQGAEVDGLWIDRPGDRSFLIRRAGGANKEYNRAAQRALGPIRGQDLKTVDPEEQERIALQIFVHGVIRDWSGIKDSEGNEVPFTPQNATAFFRQFPEVYAYLRDISNDVSYFNRQRLEELKNSQET